MMRRLRWEQKILGPNPLWMGAVAVLVLALLAVTGGDLLPLGLLGFEVLFPFFAAVAVGEWGRTRADGSYELIAAQSRSLFVWVLARYAAVFLTVSVFAAAGMAAVVLLRRELPLWELAAAYLSPAFFLSTLAAALNLCSAQEHLSTLVCGIVWLLTLLTRGLLRLPGVEYVYLFLRYAGDANGVWPVNKAVLAAAGLFLWAGILLLCRKRP